MVAAAGGITVTVESLINQHNIDPQIADRFGRKPFWIAMKKGHDAVSKLLYGYGGEPGTVQIASLDSSNDQPCLECDVCTSNIHTNVYHYHCTLCAGGNWDVCEDCKMSGAACVEMAHASVIRTMRNGIWFEITS